MLLSRREGAAVLRPYKKKTRRRRDPNEAGAGVSCTYGQEKMARSFDGRCKHRHYKGEAGRKRARCIVPLQSGRHGNLRYATHFMVSFLRFLAQSRR